MRLVTTQEITERAFTNTEDIDVALIKDFIVDASQLRWVLPVLGNDLYDELVTEYDVTGDETGWSATNTILVGKLKTAMCFFVKYELVTDMSVNQTSAGLQVISTEFSTSATDTQRGQLKDQSLIHAQVHLNEFVRWLENDDNIDDYPLYTKNGNVKNSIERRGGLVL